MIEDLLRKVSEELEKDLSADEEEIVITTASILIAEAFNNVYKRRNK